MNKIEQLVESLLQEDTTWTFNYDGDWPVAWLNTSAGLQVVYTDAGGRDISAVAEVWPVGTVYEEAGDEDEKGEHSIPLKRLQFTADSSDDDEYEWVNEVSELLQNEQAQQAWDFVVSKGKPDPYVEARRKELTR